MVESTDSPSTAWSRQLRKGVMDLAILTRLSNGPTHGYGLISSLKEDGTMAAQGAEATVYQALQRLEKTGWAESDWTTQSTAGRPRKVYSITRAGQAAREHMVAEWEQLRHSIQSLLEESP